MATDNVPTSDRPRLADLLDAGPPQTGFPYMLRQCRHGPMLYNRHDRYIGRPLAHYGEYSENEIAVLSQLLRRQHGVVVEAGANIGTHAIPIARLIGPGGHLHAFEPQRLTFQILCANLALNGIVNVSAHWAALGRMAGRAKVPQLDPETEQNFGGVGIEWAAEANSIPVTTIDALGLSRLDLVKADVEGMEGAVLEGGRETIRRLRPALYLENDRRDRSPDLIRLLQSLGYRAWWHAVPMFRPDNYAGNGENIFRTVISLNLLALPAEHRSEIDLAAVAGPDDWPGATRSSSG
ncbi:MAG: FkbM family methyltransferase [Dongiaceae bacterium]